MVTVLCLNWLQKGGLWLCDLCLSMFIFITIGFWNPEDKIYDINNFMYDKPQVLLNTDTHVLSELKLQRE